MLQPRVPLSDIPMFHQLHDRTHKFELGEQKRYYSSVDVDIYFGEYYIDEIVSLEFQVEQNVMPLFGYNSYVYDDLALGNRIVSGRFAINFTSPKYLFNLLEEVALLQEVRLETWASRTGIEVEWDVEASEDEHDPTDSVVIINKREFNLHEIPGTRITEEGSIYVTNEKNLLSAIDLGGTAGHRRLWTNRPLWRQGFDIDIVYGRRKSETWDKKSQTRDMVIKDAHIINCAQQFDIAGQPIIEQYNFIARDIEPI